jgi:actin-related protein 4
MHDYTVPNVEVKNPLAGGGVEDWVDDWDAAARLWEYAMTSKLTGPRRSGLQKKSNGVEKDGDVKMGDDEEEEEEDEDEDDEEDDNPLSIYPLLMSEPGKTSTKSREKIIEIAMENWEVPAFYLQKNGVLAA